MDTQIPPKRLYVEFERIAKNPSTFSATMNPFDPWEWTLAFFGPPDTPYANGLFLVKMVLPKVYPMNPPQLTFLTKIYHPNVTVDGVFYPCCAEPNMLDSKTWSPAFRIENVIKQVEKCMVEPVIKCDANEEIKNAYKEDKAKFEATAREWTRKYAQ